MWSPPVITAVELAARLHGRLEGDGERALRGAGTLEEAGPDMVSWLGSPDLMPRLKASQAGLVLVPIECAAPAERTVIRVADPDLAMCDVLRWFEPPRDPVPVGVDLTAVVAPDAKVEGVAIAAHVYVGARSVIGPGTELHPGVYVGADVQMGPDCVLWPGVVIRERVTLGARVVVHANTTIGGDGFGYLQRDGRHVKIPQIGTVVVEDDVEIGAGTCIDRARTGVTRIGRGTKIDNLVQVAHNVTVGEGCIIVAQCGISGSAWLGRYVVLAGQVGVVDHVKIGARAVVTAQSGVAKSWPEGQVLRGSPAREAHEQARLDAAVRRLPKLNEQVRELQQRVERLESATDDRA